MDSRGPLLQPNRRPGGRRAWDRNVAVVAAALSVAVLVYWRVSDAPFSGITTDARGSKLGATVSIQERIAAAAQRHAEGERAGPGTSPSAGTSPECPAGGRADSVSEEQCVARVAAATAGCRAETATTEAMPSWQRFLPPAFAIPGHLSGRQQQQAAQLANAEVRSKQVEVFGEEGDSGAQALGPREISVEGLGLDYPGVIRLSGHAANYTIGGMGLLRTEPYLQQSAAFYITNNWQRISTYDSFYARLVGPSIVVAECTIRRRGGSVTPSNAFSVAEYLCEYALREPGVYTLQLWAEYRDLPADIAGVANPKGNHPDPVVANSETFDRAELLLYTGLVDGRYMEGSAAEMGAFARGLDFGNSVGGGGSGAVSALDCARGLRQGRWVARQTTGCAADQYRLLREAWEWRPAGCRLREFCGDEGRACLAAKYKTIAVAGDSIARELFDEVGSIMLKRDVSWREIFPHKHASGSREVDGTMIKMMWLPDPLGTITEQLRGPVQLREQYTESDLLVISAGYWYIYRTSQATYLEGVRNLTDAVNAAVSSRTTVVWVAIPSGWMNFGYRIRPRIRAWNEAAARVVEAAGWIVLDSFHLSDARPEKTDGTHIGNDTDRGNMQGAPTLSKAVGNLLLGALCGRDEGRPAGSGAHSRPAAGNLAPTLPIEWPNWPNSRRYASREALLRAKGLLPSPPAAKKAATGAEVPHRARPAQQQQHIVMLGANALGSGGANRHSPHSAGGGRKGGRPH